METLMYVLIAVAVPYTLLQVLFRMKMNEHSIRINSDPVFSLCMGAIPGSVSFLGIGYFEQSNVIFFIGTLYMIIFYIVTIRSFLVCFNELYKEKHRLYDNSSSALYIPFSAFLTLYKTYPKTISIYKDGQIRFKEENSNTRYIILTYPDFWRLWVWYFTKGKHINKKINKEKNEEVHLKGMRELQSIMNHLAEQEEIRLQKTIKEMQTLIEDATK